jgi:hypothetical protein
MIQVEYHLNLHYHFILQVNNLEESYLRRSEDSKGTIKKVASILEKQLLSNIATTTVVVDAIY